MTWHVYIVECNDGTYYTGITRNVDERIATHNEGKGAKYTCSRRPVSLIDYVTVETRSQALKLESRVKKQHRSKKLEVLKE